MRPLLDTRIVIWLIMDDRRLTAAARRMLAAPDNDVVVSVAAMWEFTIKPALKRGDLSALPYTPKQTHDLLIRGGADVLSVTPEHAFAVERLPPLHRDPFVRLVVAQASASRFASSPTIRR